jgi:peptide chain release factor 3
MQFEVFAFRLDTEFGAPVELSPTTYRVARRTDEASAIELARTTGVRVLGRADGTLLALFESPYWLDRLQSEKPELTLERIVAD